MMKLLNIMTIFIFKAAMFTLCYFTQYYIRRCNFNHMALDNLSMDDMCPFLPLNTSGIGLTQTLDFRMIRSVLYHCATAAGNDMTIDKMTMQGLTLYHFTLYMNLDIQTF